MDSYASTKCSQGWRVVSAPGPQPAPRGGSKAAGVRGGSMARPAPPHVTRSDMVSPPLGVAAAVARVQLRVGPAPRPLMGSQGRSAPPGNDGPGEGGEARKLQEGRVARGKRRKGKGKGKGSAGPSGRGSGVEGKPELQKAKEATGSGAEALAETGPGEEGEGGGRVEEGTRGIVKGDEGSAGREKEAQGRDDGKREEYRVRLGRREDARPGRRQGRAGQAWGGTEGTGAAMAAAEEAAVARESAARPAAGPALWRLPEELLLLICSYLDMRALGRLAQVCRWLRHFTSCDLLWRRIARASLNSGFTRLGTDLMTGVPVKDRVKVSQNWRLGRCREGILLKWKCSQMPWMVLEDDSLYISQANFILAYQFHPDGASLNRRPLGVFAGHDEDVCHFVLANSHIISAGGDGKIGIHKIHSTFTVKYSAHEQEVNCVDCKEGIIVSGSRDKTAKVWPLASGQLGQCLHTIQTEDRVWSIAISPLLSSFVTGTACCGHFSPLRIWDLNSGQLVTHLGSDFPPGAGVLDVMYESPSTLLSCGYDTYVRYWDLRTSVRKCVMEWEEPHDSTLYCLQTDGNHLLATGSSYYGVVRLWDRRQRACLHAFPLTSTPLSSPVYCLRLTTKHLYAALSYNLHVLDFHNL
ncbi:F-box/WD repeat-containing protein 4 isoform X1 [Nycticebus coucang]|uniref:F-box/WD repeat-containing protein 4 isoform X1 n=1 Tax=Nycticebus coucang TaxID=9470 RepID=UPI00234DCFB4|nr:F-box/WD repeat-containing protein 4 isoform X1 [Nycticebus coucang]